MYVHACKANTLGGSHALDDVGVPELLQQRDLAERRAGDAFVLHLQADALGGLELGWGVESRVMHGMRSHHRAKADRPTLRSGTPPLVSSTALCVP